MFVYLMWRMIFPYLIFQRLLLAVYYNFCGLWEKTERCTATAIPFIYSFSGNCAASATISTFMCLWAIYIFPGSVHIFPPAEKADPSREYIIAHRHMNVEIGTEARIFLFWEYLFQIFGILSLQCVIIFYVYRAISYIPIHWILLKW